MTLGTRRPGDAFVVPDRDLDEHVFVLSDMVIQTVEVPDGPPILAFNGTTEWALDSLEAHEAVWLPREDQLRALLGDGVRQRWSGCPARRRGTPSPWRRQRYVDVTAEAAYARALLANGGGDVGRQVPRSPTG